MTAATERRKPATLLFCDVSGSTALGERVDAEAVRELMFRYFHAMRAGVERHGGTVEKFVGDAVMAAFGVPTAHEDDALRACRAACEMRERLDELNHELERRFETRLTVRIGINTGEVVAGDPSLGETFVSGDAVNVAARLEQAAAPGEIVLGEETYGLVRDFVVAEQLEPIEAKGKAEPVSAYRLLQVSAEGGPMRTLAGAFVGREEELTLLMRAFAEAVGGPSCRLVTLVGEPGVGKSRLVAELEQRIAPQAEVLYGRCLSYGEGITFWPVAEIVRRAAAIRHEDPAERGREKIAELLTGDPDAELVATRVAQAVGLAGGGAPPEELGWAIRRLLAAMGRRRPSLVVVDDVHWAEDVLLDLLAGLPDAVRDAPLLILCLARPELLEERPDWPSVVRLDPLGAAEADELVQRLLGENDVELRERVLARARGNPLFLEELAALVEHDQGEGSLPTSLSGLLAARLDRLEERARAALERGSVEGEIFHRGAVAELSSSEERAGIGEQLRTLASQELVRPAQAIFVGEAAFRFRHLLIRDAAYAALAKRLRADLHERFASWLERTVGDRLPEVEEIVGYHFEQAVRYRAELGLETEELSSQAAAHLAAAGRRAGDRGDVRAAARLLDRATELLTRRRRAPELLLTFGRVLMAAGELERAQATFEQTEAAARADGDRSVELQAVLERRLLGTMTETELDSGALLRAAEEAIPELDRAGDDRGLATAWRAIALTHHFALRVGPRQEAYERAVAHARRAGDELLESNLLLQMGGGFEFGPIPVEEGVRRCQEVLERPLNHSVESGYVGVLAMLEAMRGRFEQARELSRRTEAMVAELGNAWGVAVQGMVAGDVELLAGDYEAAEREARRTLAHVEGVGLAGWVTHVSGDLAEISYRRGRYDEAERYAEKCRDGAASGDVTEEAQWRQVKAKVLARRARFEDAEPLAREAVELLEPTDALNIKAAAQLALAEVLELADRADEAAEAREEARRIYEQKGNVVAAGAVARE